MDVDDERLDVVGGLATRMLDRTGWRGELSLTTDLDRAVDGADFVLVQIRVGGQAARLRDETIPLACGCIGQETTGAGGFAKAMRTVPVCCRSPTASASSPPTTRGSSTSRTRSASSRARCSTPVIARSASATSRSGSSATSRSCSASSRSASSSTRSGSTTSRGCGACSSTAATSCPSCSQRTATSSPSTPGCERSVLDDLGVLPSYYLHYFYDHDRVLEELREATPRAAAVAEIERQLLELYRDPATTDEAGAARAARRRVLQRGGGRARRVARSRRRRRARGRRAEQRRARRARGRRRRRGARRASAAA